MKVERTQFIGHYGLTFAVTRFTVTPESRSELRSLCFLEVPKAVPEVCSRIADLYEKMLAGDFPCLITVAIAKPLTRKQGDVLNERRAQTASLIGGAFGAPFDPISSLLSKAVESRVTNFVLDKLPTYHAGDIIIGFEALVRGGIGPQRSTSSMIIKSFGG